MAMTQILLTKIKSFHDVWINIPFLYDFYEAFEFSRQNINWIEIQIFGNFDLNFCLCHENINPKFWSIWIFGHFLEIFKKN